MFDALIRDIAVRFAIGESASRALLAILLDTLFDPRNGRLSGIAAQFRQRGLEGVFRSWIGDAPPRSIDPRQLEHVLGRDEMVAMAQGIGVASDGTARSLHCQSGRRDSNPRPPPWQGGALPTEPRPRGAHSTSGPRPVR